MHAHRNVDSRASIAKAVGIVIRAAVAALVVVNLPGSASAQGTVSWDFHADDQGWRVADLHTGGPYDPPIAYYPVSYKGSGGDPGGHILADDPSNNTYTFDAPLPSPVDWSGLIGGKLSFSLKTTHDTYTSERYVILVGSGKVALSEFDLPGSTWTRYSIPLTAASFTHADGAPLSDAEFAAIMGKVTAFRISAEYANSPVETTSLDSVVLAGQGPGTPFCFGDPGSGTPCPCKNDNDGSVPGSGCANGAFASGAKLTGSGVASVSGDTLRLETTGLDPKNAGLYFQANKPIDGGNGIPFGDGLRCAGGGLIRLQVRFSDASGASSTTVAIGAKGGVSAGDIKCYQCWYRDTSGSQPCGVGVNDFNLSNAYRITWLP